MNSVSFLSTTRRKITKCDQCYSFPLLSTPWSSFTSILPTICYTFPKWWLLKCKYGMNVPPKIYVLRLNLHCEVLKKLNLTMMFEVEPFVISIQYGH